VHEAVQKSGMNMNDGCTATVNEIIIFSSSDGHMNQMDHIEVWSNRAPRLQTVFLQRSAAE
jgi:hypothetical protein